jgi:glycosyltransferase involved in cell wall biosynthesis
MANRDDKIIDNNADSLENPCIIDGLKEIIREKDERINEYERIINVASEAMTKEYIRYIKEVRKLNKYKKTVKRSKMLRVARRLKKISRIPARIVRKARRKFGELRSKGRGTRINPGVSVVIPTYRDNPGIYKAVQSTLDQTYPAAQLEILIIVNGPDKPYHEKLLMEYADIPGIRVLYTPRKGPGAARNIGIASASKEFLFFLDDDDYITEGYIQELADRAKPHINIVFGRLMDQRVDGTCDHDTYINKGIKKLGNKVTDKYNYARSQFGNLTCKLYRAGMLQNDFVEIPEDMLHTEDVMYWALNFGHIKGKVAAVDPDSQEGYIRVLTESSTSRVAESKMESFLFDKLEMIGELTRLFFDAKTTVNHKKFIKHLIIAQGLYIIRACDVDGSASLKAKIYDYINTHRDILLPEYMFATKRGIAFCQLFPPELDPSANVAAKRLKQIGDIENERIEWDVLKQDRSEKRDSDVLFNQLYVSFVCHHKFAVGNANMNNRAWAASAFNFSALQKAQYIYSRSMQPGSHIAAYNYKKLYSKAKWYAEFSDPLSRDVNGDKRRADNLFEDIERMVYEHADRIIFTNSNQMEYMLGYNPSKELESSIRNRSMVLRHPEIDSRYVHFIRRDYHLNSDKINIAYFGSFYKTRSHDNMLNLLLDPRIVLHIFSPDYFDSDYHRIHKDVRSRGFDVSRLKTNNAVPYFEMLNIASKMDYLFIEDTDFPGVVNPFLPSKFTDYLVSGSMIIAMIRRGSPMSGIEGGQIIKTERITGEFLSSLSKKI